MTFIDEVLLHAKAGDGGNGAVAWRREAHVPKGGPAGGDGGDGGDVVLIAESGIHSLLDFKYNPHLHAKHGGQGRGKKQAGEFGTPAIARVPIGTQVFDDNTGELLADLTDHDQRVVVCKGGSGGFGNSHFATPSRQAPEFAKPGLAGEERNLRLELKLMADVGLLGFPNAGKSTFLSRVSAARPKIAAYPFTTLVPQLGVVKVDGDKPGGRNFVVADIPGLIEGAAEGAGLGVQFLKHLERVRVLLHLVEVPLEIAASTTAAWDDDDSGGSHHKTRGPVDLVERYEALRSELSRFNEELAAVPEIVAINKIDLVGSGVDDAKKLDDVKKLTKHLAKKGITLHFVSGASGQGLRELVFTLSNHVDQVRGPVVKAAFNPFARARY